MTNQERIKKYLVGEKGYLKSDISNGKVIMLSGKWGSGKTHFWQKEIASDELKQELKDKREVYSYISLYGKTSIEEIENDIFSQAYSSAIGGENFVTKGFSTFTKRMKRFGSSKIANGLNEEQNDNIERTALSRLNNGGILCFDDFERKSKDIDLNDLFGFITQLTLNFNCKVVIILNDDVFEGEEKNVFSNVKEKTVSKFLYYKPEIIELFNLIFEYDKRYLELKEYKELILNNLIASQEVNARIYIQIFENLLEFTLYIKDIKNESKYLKYFIFQNINFILNHKIFKLIKNEKSSIEVLDNIKNKNESINKCIEEIINKNWNYEKNYDVVNNLNFEQLPKNEINSIYFQVSLDCLIIKSKYEDRDMENYIINVIHNFIETGILIDE
ncbi:P-loop NTPase fold protein [Poseidonibacter lekithochrous]|uniref:P-loop NTPase fold protein n=1 Tax=Poseidonibacter lekithochrous TaxID=1904463 RepID=UPI0008FC5FC8|nr:P-loop NTPase fold protein [Poseidonibacter lekithochrous]QKJ24429.1 hypothetical protein ALEK_3225 [Poseidonibacter lekithochrous]